MSDRIPGSSWSNPVWHGKWRIYVSDCPFDHPEFNFVYVHDDFDGDGDSRHGYARTVDAAKAEIDERHDASDPAPERTEIPSQPQGAPEQGP